jgi:Tfp pilus assembly protein PilX
MTTNTPPTPGRGEDGWALVTAVALMAIMLVIGAATLASVDFESKQTREQRELESSLNLAEGVLYAQAFALARKWPAPLKSGAAYPQTCSSALATATDGKCPNRENLAASNAAWKNTAAFASIDYLSDNKGSWVTRVRDNYGALAASYDAAQVDTTLSGTLGSCVTPCTYDFNDDKSLWVESRTVVRGRARRVVALMKLEQIQEGVPRTGLTSGAIAMTNNAAGDYNATGAQAIVRCKPDSEKENDATCTNYSKNNNVTPPPVEGDVGNLMTAEMIERFKERAQIDGTYYTGCPTNLVGAVVFSEYCPAQSGDSPGQTYTASGTTPCSVPAGMAGPCANSLSKPGLLIVRCGGLRLQTGTFIGVMYFVNGSDGTNGNNCLDPDDGGPVQVGQKRGDWCPKNAQKDSQRVVLDTQAGAGVWGAIAADGKACVQLGSNGNNFQFDPNVFNAIKSYGTVGLVQNTWRELPPG